MLSIDLFENLFILLNTKNFFTCEKKTQNLNNEKPPKLNKK